MKAWKTSFCLISSLRFSVYLLKIGLFDVESFSLSQSIRTSRTPNFFPPINWKYRPNFVIFWKVTNLCSYEVEIFGLMSIIFIVKMKCCMIVRAISFSIGNSMALKSLLIQPQEITANRVCFRVVFDTFGAEVFVFEFLKMCYLKSTQKVKSTSIYFTLSW